MIEIPVIVDSTGLVRPAFIVTVQLGGVAFGCSFHWNARAAAWSFGLLTAAGTVIVDGLAVRVGSLLYPFLRSGMPLGLFFAVDTAQKNEDPGRDELGKRVRIYFMEPGDL